MTEQAPQPPADEEPIAPAPDAPQEADQAPSLTYHEYLKLTHPGKSDAEIAKMIRKENRYAWLVRFQILAAVIIVAIILVLIFTN